MIKGTKRRLNDFGYCDGGKLRKSEIDRDVKDKVFRNNEKLDVAIRE